MPALTAAGSGWFPSRRSRGVNTPLADWRLSASARPANIGPVGCSRRSESPDRGRLGRRFGWRWRGRAPGRAGAAWSRSASRSRRRRWAGSSAGRRSPPTAACATALEDVPVAQRSFTATWLGTPPAGGYAEIDRAATAALRRLGPGPPARTLAFPELNLGGRLVELGAVTDPARWLRLRVGPAAAHVRPEPGARSSRRAALPSSSVSEPGLRLVVVGHTAGPLPLSLAPLTRSCPPGEGRPAAGADRGRRLAALRAARLLGALPRLRVDDADRARRAARLADRRPARPRGRRRAQRPPSGHAVRPHRAHEHARRAAARRRDRGPAHAARGRRRGRPAARVRAARGGRAAARRRHRVGPARAPRRPPRAAVDVRVGRGGLDHLRRSGPGCARGGGRGGDRRRPGGGGRDGRAPAHDLLRPRHHRHRRGLGGRCGGARRRRAHGRRRPAGRPGARPRPGRPGHRRRGGARRRPRQRRLDVPGRRLRPAARPAARPRRPRRGDRDRPPRRAAAAPGGTRAPPRPAQRAARARVARPRGRTPDPGGRVPGRGDRPRRVRGRLPHHPRPGRARPGRVPGAARRSPCRRARRCGCRSTSPRWAPTAGSPRTRWRRRCSAPARPRPHRGCRSRPRCSASRPARSRPSATGAPTSPRCRSGAVAAALRPSQPPTLRGADLPPARTGSSSR